MDLSTGHLGGRNSELLDKQIRCCHVDYRTAFLHERACEQQLVSARNMPFIRSDLAVDGWYSVDWDPCAVLQQSRLQTKLSVGRPETEMLFSSSL